MVSSATIKPVQRLIDYLLKQGDKIRNMTSQYDVNYIIEPRGWSIHEDGRAIAHYLTSLKINVTRSDKFIRNGIIHYGTNDLVLGNKSILNPNPQVRVLVAWFHVIPSDPRLNLLPEILPKVDYWHTACTTTRKDLTDLGIPSNKIALIPLAIDLDLFQPITDQHRSERRQKLGIPEDHLVIGSFQKDGVGWGAGNDPKLIKGPDILCDCLQELQRRVKIFVILTAPARGYVKERLKESGIPFQYYNLAQLGELPWYYQLLDFYLVTSRIEGGPKAILEAMACGIPVLSTRVGMAPDVIKSGQNGFLIDSYDPKQICSAILEIIDDKSGFQSVVKTGLETVRQYGWQKLSAQYLDLYNLPQLN